MKSCISRLSCCGLLFLCFVQPLTAQNAATPAPTATPAAALPPVVARYEQMLAASPSKGTAFDKVYQYYFAGEGLDALAARWRTRAVSKEPNADSFALLQGLLAERRARPDDARAFYQKYNDAHPRDPRGWTALGELETSAGRFGPAADALTHAISPSAQPPVPTSARPALFRELARAQARNFLVVASLTTWRRLAGEFADDPGILQEVGEAFQEAQSYDEARATFERVRELAKRNNDAFGRVNATLRTGQVEESRGKSKEAIAIYESVVSEAKAGSWLEREARARIESLYRGQEDLPGLADYYKKSLADHPKSVETATRLAAVLVELNRRDEAIDLLKQAVAWAPDRQELAVELARRLAEGNRPAEAVTVMEKLTVTASEEKSYWQLLGDARWQLLETLPPDAPATDKAKLRAQSLAAWNHLSPADAKPDPAATGQLADLLGSHHLTEEALAQFARAAAQGPDLPDAYERWAAYLAQLGRKDEARKTAAGIVDGSPKNRTAGNYARLATALDRLDDLDGALDATAKGLALDPRNFDLLSLRWQFLTSRKKWDEAIALYPATLAAAPNVYFVEQAQARHLGALQAANKLDETRKTLAARLGAQPGLDEGDLALLIRADLQARGGDGEDGKPDDRADEIRRALAESRARFPKSPTFARLEVEAAKRAHDTPGQVAALERLIELQPAQRVDALAEIAHVWRDDGKDDKAIAAAETLVAASPANAGSHLLLADLLLGAGRNDEAVARLREAVRLSDKPNEVRLRLARIQTDLGLVAEARETLDDAFEGAADARERLGLMRQLTTAYQADNKLDELIARFQRLQQGEADGWRYALYLSELYQVTQDMAAARRELAKALAARPKDSALLRQLTRLATQENNSAEVVRYQTLLTEAEPSDANQLALVIAQLGDALPTEALNTLRAHMTAILRVPDAWNTLLPLLARNDLTDKASALLAAELGAGGKDLRSRFMLAMFQAGSGNVDAAREAFWAVFDTRTPRAQTPPAAPPKSASATAALGRNERLARLFYGGSSPAEQRFNDASRARYVVQAMLAPGGLNSLGGSARSLNALSLSTASGAGGSRAASAPDPIDTARDTALMYVAALAVRDNSAEEFLAETDRRLAARDSTRADRLVAYSLLDFVDSELREIAAQIKEPEEGLDAFCVSRLMYMATYNNPSNRRNSPQAPLTPAQCAAAAPLLDPLFARMIAADPDAGVGLESADLMRYYYLQGLEQKDKADEIRRRALAGLDEKASPDRLESGLDLLLLGDFTADDRAQIRAVCRALGTTRKATPQGASINNQMQYYPGQLLQEDSAAAKLSTADFASVMADLISLLYPAAPPPVNSGGALSARRATGNTTREDNYLPASRFFDPTIVGAFQSLPQALSQGGDSERLKAVLAELDRQAADFPPTRKIYPRLVAIYFAASSRDWPGALSRVKVLQTDAPDDPDVRLLAAVLLGHNDRHADAVALLRDLDPARSGESAANVQRLLLQEAQAAKDTDVAKAAALRLVALRPTGDEREPLIATLKELGLNEQAEQLSRVVTGVTASRSGRAGGSKASPLSPQTASQIQSLAAKKDEPGAMALIRAVFAALPPATSASSSAYAYGRNNDRSDYVVRAAVSALRRLNKWDEFVSETEKARAKDPDSLTLNYQLAVLYGSGREDDAAPPHAFARDLPGAVWLKLAREGDEIVGSVSPDGQAWTGVGRAKLDLGAAPIAALALGSAEDRATGTIDQIAFTPESTPPAAGSPPSGSTLPAPWQTTRLESGDIPPNPPLAPPAWKDGAFTLEDFKSKFFAASRDAGSLVYRPLSGATATVIRVPAGDKLPSSARLGLVWRADLSPDAPGVALFLNRGSADFTHRDQPDRAAAAWRKVIALRPKETTYLQSFARYLAQHSGRAEAADIGRRYLELDPAAAFASSDELVEMFGPGGLPDLVKRVLAWDPVKGGSNARYYNNPFLPVARACESAKRPDLVIALGRRAAELDKTRPGSQYLDNDTRKLLLTALLDAGRRDEARDILLACYLPPADAAATAASSRASLGFRNVGSNQRSEGGMREVLTNMSWSNEGVELNGLDPLRAVAASGLLSDLQSALVARQTADPKAFADDGLDWLQVLLKIEARDPSIAAELPAQLNTLATLKNFGGGPLPSYESRAALALELSNRLLRWPGQESLASEALRAAGRMQLGISSSMKAFVRMQEARGELLLGDTVSALATLKDGARAFVNGPYSRNDEEVRRCLTLLSRCGPDGDAAFLDLARQTASTRQSNNSSRDEDITLEKNLRTGEDGRFRGLAWLLDEGAADSPDATVVYELQPQPTPGPNASRAATGATSRGRSFAKSEGERALTLFHGPDDKHLTPLTQLKISSTYGVWTGPVPRGKGVLKVTIDAPRANDAEPGKPVEGDALPILRAPNLLANPGFNGLAERPIGDKFSIEGWRDLPQGFWRNTSGENPFPGRPYVSFSPGAPRQQNTIRSARVPVDKDHAYLLSGWLRNSQPYNQAYLSVRYLDAEGKELGNNNLSPVQTNAWARTLVRLTGSAKSGEGSMVIPPQAAFIELTIQCNSATDWTGLFFGRVD